MKISSRCLYLLLVLFALASCRTIEESELATTTPAKSIRFDYNKLEDLLDVYLVENKVSYYQAISPSAAQTAFALTDIPVTKSRSAETVSDADRSIKARMKSLHDQLGLALAGSGEIDRALLSEIQKEIAHLQQQLANLEQENRSTNDAFIMSQLESEKIDELLEKIGATVADSESKTRREKWGNCYIRYKDSEDPIESVSPESLNSASIWRDSSIMSHQVPPSATWVKFTPKHEQGAYILIGYSTKCGINVFDHPDKGANLHYIGRVTVGEEIRKFYSFLSTDDKWNVRLNIRHPVYLKIENL